MLTRNSITSGEYLQSYSWLPQSIRWTQREIEDSLQATLDARKPDGDVWVFAYGSLLWNPIIDFAEQTVAHLTGWHRSFCLKLFSEQQTNNSAGRMLAIEEGGITSGAAYRISKCKLREELLLVWIREMAIGSYNPVWVPIKLADGTTTDAITFVADLQRDQYQSNSNIEVVAPLIASASGISGPNTDYVFKLESSLNKLGLIDQYVSDLCDAIRKILDQATLSSFISNSASLKNQGV